MYPETLVPQPLQDHRGRKLSLQVAEGELEYVQGITGSAFPAPPHSLISKDLSASRLGSSFSVYHVVYPTDASQPRALEGKGDGLWENQGRGAKPSFGRRRVW